MAPLASDKIWTNSAHNEFCEQATFMTGLLKIYLKNQSTAPIQFKTSSIALQFFPLAIRFRKLITSKGTCLYK